LCNHPVAGIQHVAGNLRLNGIHIIHQGRWRNNATEENSRGKKDQGHRWFRSDFLCRER